MSILTNSAPTTIESLVEQILITRQISSIHYEQIQLILHYDIVNDQEKTLIDRVLYGIRHGLVKQVA
ncbi:MAG: hypothetical protein HC916_13530 [Coleofasciculaceae cyanobacterium SM2_1_6]|nr:hypothetical protein [Coleofasciculaceae cyanobacterium SM2_1_6]